MKCKSHASQKRLNTKELNGFIQSPKPRAEGSSPSAPAKKAPVTFVAGVFVLEKKDLNPRGSAR